MEHGFIGKIIMPDKGRGCVAEETNWEEEGRKAFVEGKIRPGLPKNYPTLDKHTVQNEREYIRGFEAQQSEWLAGNGFAGLESYAKELDEQRENDAL